MELIKKSLGRWISAAIVLVIGILCIVAGAQFNDLNGSAGDTVNAISMVLGISFIVVGSLGILRAIIGALITKEGFAAAATTGGTSLALGIWFVCVKTAFSLISLAISFVPYVLIVLGAVMAVDTVFLIVKGIQEKRMKQGLASIIVGAIIAAACIVLGCLCIGDDPVIQGGTQLIIFGIILIIYAVFMVLSTFFAIPVTIAKTTVETIDARK